MCKVMKKKGVSIMLGKLPSIWVKSLGKQSFLLKVLTILVYNLKNR